MVVFSLFYSDDNPDSQPYFKYTGASNGNTAVTTSASNGNTDYYNLQQLEENYQVSFFKFLCLIARVAIQSNCFTCFYYSFNILY